MKHDQKWKINNMLVDIVAGLAVSVLISFLLIIGIAFIIHGGKMDEASAGYIVLFVQAVAVFGGAFVAGKRSKRKYAIVCGSVGTAYCFLLLGMTVIFFGGSFNLLGAGLGVCAIGTVLACATCMINKKKTRRRK